MVQRSGLIIAAVCIVLGVAPERVAAYECGSVSLDDVGNDVALGETAFWGYNPTTHKYQWFRDGDLAVCWTDSSGENYVVVSGCNTLSGSGDWVTIEAKEGNDRLAPAASNFSCDGHFVFYWSTDFYFGVNGIMGTGSDEAYGTPNRDYFWSNYDDWSAAADFAYDRLCGYDGNDYLFGDKDDSYLAYYECMNGADGTDYCYGGDDSSTYDYGSNGGACNTIVNAASSSVTCSCGAYPPDAASWM